MPYKTFSRVRYNAFYAQDQLTRGRLTLSGALRYDHSWSYYPEQQIGGRRTFLPVQFTTFPQSKGVIGYNDITPRMGVAYDLFGTGKTAVKFNAGQVSRSRRQRQRQLLGAAAERRASQLTQSRAVDRRQRQLHSPTAIC